MSFLAFSIRKGQLWLNTLLPFLFVSDMLYGIMELYNIKSQVTPGVILRGLVVGVAFCVVFTKSEFLGGRLLLWIVFMISTALPGLFAGLLCGDGPFFEVSVFFKTLYLPLVTGLLVVIIRRYRMQSDNVLRAIEYSAYVMGIALLFSQHIGVAFQTYGDYAFGTRGIFYAQNDMTLAFGLSLLAAGYRLATTRFSWLRLTLFGMSAFACIEIGTRASLAVMVGVCFAIGVCQIWGLSRWNGERSRRSKKWLIIMSLIGLAATVVVYGAAKQMEFGYQKKKWEQIAKGEFPRVLLVSAGAQYLSERSGWLNLLGEGADAFQRGVAKHFPGAEDRRMVEVDWMDVFGSYGIFFTLLIYGFGFNSLLLAARRFVVYRAPLYGLLAFAALLYLGHSAVAGHALVSPIPSTLMAAYLAVLLVSNWRKPRVCE